MFDHFRRQFADSFTREFAVEKHIDWAVHPLRTLEEKLEESLSIRWNAYHELLTNIANLSYFDVERIIKRFLEAVDTYAEFRQSKETVEMLDTMLANCTDEAMANRLNNLTV